MRRVADNVTDVAGATGDILHLIKWTLNSNIIIYFDGWHVFGAAAVLRSIAQTLPSMKAPTPKLCFGRTIYIDCSRWISKRAMQKKIAQELRLDHKTMAMFDEQDEEDDFNGVDYGSRDAIRNVAPVIDRTLRESRFMMIFINGSDDEVALGRLGVPESSDCVIIWTFGGRFMTVKDLFSTDGISKKLRYTDAFVLSNYLASDLTSSQFMALFREEAANIVARRPACMWGIDLTTVVDCCLYGLLLYHNFRSTTGFVWPAHAPNYWICDGIIHGDRAREISNALRPEISFECDASMLDVVFKKLKEDPNTPFLVVKHDDDDDVYEKRPCYRWRHHYRWVSITLKNKKVHEGMQTIFARASSIFLASETKDSPCGLPNGFFKKCRNLGVLVLSCCAFSFVSPPFLHCHTLRFLGLDHCSDDTNAVELERGGCAAGWACLQSLWVIDLYYTDWVEMLSEEKLELMANLMELNIEGVRWPRWTRHQLQKILPNLQQLRIIRPMYDEEETTSSDIGDSFLMANTSLELLDLSGSNRGMGRNLPAITSKASHLQVLILDGCDGLEDVVLANNSSLRSFSFDGYGPAFHQTSTVELPPKMSRPKHPPDADKKGVVKTSKISLEGCTRLDNLFLRGLPNLEELDLSGCAIKVLDFGAMVVDVPRLKRLFLLGCERLRAIKRGSNKPLLDLICIDTRPGSERVLGRAWPSSIGARPLVHAVATDARLVWSLWDYILRPDSSVCYFNISITSSAAFSDGAVQPEATQSKEIMVGSSDQRRRCAVATVGLYGDVFTKAGDGPSPMQAFPQVPTEQFDRHIEIGDGSRCVQSEVVEIPDPYLATNLASVMIRYTQSLHVHDVSTCSNTIPTEFLHSLRWCRVERCLNLHAVFHPGAEDSGKLETIWASDLLMARCIWSQGVIRRGAFNRFKSLQHLHLRRCPSLKFALAMGSLPSFPSLETLHIIHCGDLRHVFVPQDEEHQHPSVQFPMLTTIHLHDLSSLQQICKAAEMQAPTLETIRIRGCPNLRRLPGLTGREPGMRRPMVEVEKDVWDALEWDGVDVGHHPSLYEPPVHSRYYKRRMLRGTLLR